MPSARTWRWRHMAILFSVCFMMFAVCMDGLPSMQMSSSRSQIIPRHRIIWDRELRSESRGRGYGEKIYSTCEFFRVIPQRRVSTRVENLNPNTIVLYWSGKFRSLPNFWFHWFRKTWWDHQWKTFSEEISGTGSGWSESFITGETGFDAKITGFLKPI